MRNPKINIFIAIFLFCGGFHSILSAQTLTAETESTQVSVGQQFQVEYSINAAGSGFTPPPFTGFMAQGPMTGQSTQMNLTTGSSITTLTFSYILVPQSEGTFTISPASIKCGGKTITSNSLTIKVVKGAAGATAQAGGQQNQPGNAAPAEITGKNTNLFIRIVPSKAKAYEGESVTATIKIYTRLNIESIQETDAPDFSGFYTEDITQNNHGQLSATNETVDGVPYKVAIFQQKILFPQRTGKIKINPVTMQCIVDEQVKSKNYFDQFFGGSYKRVPYSVKSDPLTIEVMPLPKTEKNFSGAVGEFTLKGIIDKKKVKANEALNLTLTVTGEGNLKLIDTLPLQFPSDFDHYDPKISDHFSVTSAGVSGSRTFNYLIIPRHPGNYKIPPVDFTYFNTKKKEYVSLSTPEMELEIAKGDNNSSSSVTVSGPVEKEDVKTLGSDIRYIHSGHEAYYHTDNFFLYSAPFFAGLFAPILAFIGFVIGRRRYVELHKDTVALKKRGATRMAKKRLKIAHQNIASANKEVFYAELLNALNGYFSDKFTIPLADLSRDRITENLTQKNAKPETQQMVNKILDDCEFARYAPASVAGNLGEVYASAVKLITLLEDEIA
ncbi:MAG TPA: BatD family protein [Bacteroidia bacterium]|jgi:hypothetical protein|nr:BatD family protein [Bacteroidia bacterium]